MHILEEVKILKNTRIKGPYYHLQLKSNALASQATPGQFLHINIGAEYDPLLRRPLSLCQIIKDEGILGILYQLKGRGTTLLTKKREGETLDVLGPCGRGFQLPSKGPVLLVAGGIGVAPLGALIDEITQKGLEVDLLLGASTEKDLLLLDSFNHPLLFLSLATEDGSQGFCGLVTDLMKDVLENRDYSLLYGCGPLPMLKILVSLSSARNLPCQVSLEGRMGCGIGSCLTCGVKKREGNGYYRLCAEGPVFNGEEVLLYEDGHGD